jgi:hypothetical protein
MHLVAGCSTTAATHLMNKLNLLTSSTNWMADFAQNSSQRKLMTIIKFNIWKAYVNLIYSDGTQLDWMKYAEIEWFLYKDL